MRKTTCLVRIFACLSAAVVPTGLHAQELIADGNFEGAGLSPWEVAAPAGSSITTVNENSPFLTRYPAGARSVRVADDDSEFETPYFKQAFTGQSGLRFSFDFKSPAGTPDSSWYVIWSGDDNTSAFFFSIGGPDGASIQLNRNTVSTLEPNVWYHVEGSASAPGQSVTGAIVNSRGERTTFSGGFAFGALTALNGVTVTDGDQGRNETVILDNFSAEPMAIASASLSIARAPQDQITVSWTAAGYTLQASSEIGTGAAWTNVPTDGQIFTTSADEPMQFFRLISL